ncbi:MAG: hypothetical protein HQ534_04740 [Armatimonadetes bacterium]|nr:hypothetical protein [Armatimonadota bacterium]
MSINEISKIVEIVVPIIGIILAIISVIVAYFLLRESRKMHVLSSSPNLVFSFHSSSQNRILGRLENIGYGTAYNINVKVDPDFQIMGRKSLQKIFKNVNYLSPKQCYDIDYGVINVDNNLKVFKKHKLTITWTRKKQDKKKEIFIANFEEDYFINFPCSHSFSDLVNSIDNLNNNLERYLSTV